MLGWLLNLAYLALLAAITPWLVLKSVTQGKYRQGWAEKLWGTVPVRRGDRPCLWLHAVSVGEVLQLRPIVEGLMRQQPDLEFVISVTTSTGYGVACERYPQCRVVYYPLDFTWSVARALDRLRPTAIALVELELWPNFVFAAATRRIPVMLINGRITERSFRGYLRIRPLVQAMLVRLRRLLVQNEVYAARFSRLGAARNRITVTGSIKFDGVQTDRNNPRTCELRQLLGLDGADRVFIAGSTQAPEEQYAIDAWLAVRNDHPDLKLILVPRHKERFEEVARLVTENYKLPLLRRSQLLANADSDLAPPTQLRTPHSALHTPVLLLDTLGELSACWGLADIAFVGGSLTQRGGQNMIEPAAYGAAVLFGPNTWNFKDVVELLLGQEAAVVVHNPSELIEELRQLLADPERGRRRGKRAQALVVNQRGATERTLDLINSTLAETRRTAAERQPRAA
jgi:3-deoxy-D-manno-octulosonic-acid transferase